MAVGSGATREGDLAAGRLDRGVGGVEPGDRERRDGREEPPPSSAPARAARPRSRTARICASRSAPQRSTRAVAAPLAAAASASTPSPRRTSASRAARTPPTATAQAVSSRPAVSTGAPAPLRPRAPSWRRGRAPPGSARTAPQRALWRDRPARAGQDGQSGRGPCRGPCSAYRRIARPTASARRPLSDACPTPVTTGTGESAMARARSSPSSGARPARAPPPRTSRTRSG